MLIEELEIIEDFGEEKETELKKLLEKSVSENKVNWVGIECVNNDDSMLDALVFMQQFAKFIESIKADLLVITSTITCSVEVNKTPAKIKVKLFNEKPKVVENIIN